MLSPVVFQTPNKQFTECSLGAVDWRVVGGHRKRADTNISPTRTR